MSNYQVTYAKLISMVRPFFMQRGICDLADNDTLMLYINLAIQDIYNKDTFTFSNVTETLQPTSTANGQSLFTTQFPISKVSGICNENWDMCWTLWKTEEWDDSYYKFTTWTDTIITDESVKEITVSYSKWYCWIEYNNAVDWTVTNTPWNNINNNWSQTIVPLPHSYLPALVKKIYDWASPINLMVWETAQYDFHWHAESRLSELISQDAMTDNLSITM